MEAIFNKLEGKGNNNLEFLIQWMKEAKILDAAKAEAEHRVRELFKDVPDPRNIAMDKFKEVVSQFADEQKKSIEEFTSQLVGQGPAFLQMAEKLNLEAESSPYHQPVDAHENEHEVHEDDHGEDQDHGSDEYSYEDDHQEDHEDYQEEEHEEDAQSDEVEPPHEDD